MMYINCVVQVVAHEWVWFCFFQSIKEDKAEQEHGK